MHDDQIARLRTIAAHAGDIAMVGVCELAMHGMIARDTALSLTERAGLKRRFPSPAAARRECARVLRDMAAQRET